MRASQLYCLMLVAPVTIASTGGDHFNLDVSASSQLTDNAQKQYVESIKIEERQDLYQLGLNTAYKSDWYDFKARYSLVDQQYTEHSQPNYTSLVGDLQLDLGDNFYPAHLKVLHSSESLLNAPDAIDLSTNRDQRSILTAEPSLRWSATEADNLITSLRLSEVSFDKESAKNSTAKGAQLAWERDISKVDKITFTALTNKTSFDFNSSLEYTLDSLLAGYAVTLSHLEYEVSVGASRVVQEVQNIDFTRPNFDASIKYLAGPNTVSIVANRKIIDSSVGSGALTGLSNSDSSQSGGAGLDLIDLMSASVNLTTNAICERCTLNVSLEASKESYEVLIEDSVVNAVRGAFSYRVARNGNLVFSYWRQKRNFESNSFRFDSADNNYEIRYSYTFVNKISINAYMKKYVRDSADKFASYDEHVTGIKLAYSF